MNTKINYLYRDGGNYKVRNTCIIAGAVSEEDKTKIINSVDHDFFFFKPALIGLPAKDFVSLGYDEEPDDSDWFELGDGCDDEESIRESAFELTDEMPDVNMSINELVKSFEEAYTRKWSY